MAFPACPNWHRPPEITRGNCREHLAILDQLKAGERETAAALLRRHLEGASRLKRTMDRSAFPAST
jgi:DNA-binding GntR family transcriptional regulator